MTELTCCMHCDPDKAWAAREGLDLGPENKARCLACGFVTERVRSDIPELRGIPDLGQTTILCRAPEVEA